MRTRNARQNVTGRRGSTRGGLKEAEGASVDLALPSLHGKQNGNADAVQCSSMTNDKLPASQCLCRPV